MGSRISGMKREFLAKYVTCKKVSDAFRLLLHLYPVPRRDHPLIAALVFTFRGFSFLCGRTKAVAIALLSWEAAIPPRSPSRAPEKNAS